jgi:plastocyanin
MPSLDLRADRARASALAALGLAGLAGLALLLGACNAAPADPPESFDPGAPQITASGERFDQAELDVPANQAFELVLNNKDSEVHNVSIYSDEGHSKEVFRGALQGNGTKVYHVQALAPGTYYFQCDVHPQMKGIVVVGAG